jgi:hypothetical protein
MQSCFGNDHFRFLSSSFGPAHNIDSERFTTLAEVQKRLLRKQSYVALAVSYSPAMCCPFDLSPHIPTSPTTTTTVMIEGRELRVLATQQISMSPVCAKPNRTARRHVHFDDHDSVIPSTSSSALPDDFSLEDDASTWYRLEELEKFRNEARDLSREMKYHDELVHYADQGNSSDSDSSFSASSSHRLPSLARNSLTRGLEQRSCMERQRRKYLSNRFLLKVAPKLYQENPGKLAELAQKCNAWATDLALEEASRDYTRVYLSEDAAGFPFEALPPLFTCRKRSVSREDGTEHLRKRICTTTSPTTPIVQISR